MHSLIYFQTRYPRVFLLDEEVVQVVLTKFGDHNDASTEYI